MLTILQGDCLARLRELPEASAHCCVTSPPYWGLRDYGVAGQIGLEPTATGYLEKMVEVFAEVRRVLRPDGTCWVNLGDCYTASGWGGGVGEKSTIQSRQHPHDRSARRVRYEGNRIGKRSSFRRDRHPFRSVPHKAADGLGPKNLIGLPWRLAFALQEDGWILRADIIWAKPNPMPESVTDRPTKAHEYVFLFSKSKRYHYDSEAIKEDASDAMLLEVAQGYQGHLGLKDYEAAGVQNPSTVKERIIANARKRADAVGGNKHTGETTKHSNGSVYAGRVKVNKRSVWSVPTAPYLDAHFATYPPDLIKPCILAGCPVGGTVLDPFAGSGTTGAVALELGRKAVLIELNPDYVALIRHRCAVTPGFL